MQNIQSTQIEKTVAALLKGDAWKATNYLSDKVIVRASRQMHGKKLSNQGNLTVVLTVGKPNYAEREFVALCKKAGEKFPLKKIQLKFPPKPAVKKKK